MTDTESSLAEAPVADAELDVEANAEVETDQTEEVAEGEAEEVEPEDDSEEIEHEGERYKVPKALKDAFLRQADYTRKTQEIAETRKALEARNAELAQQAEVFRETSEKRVQLAIIDQQLSQLDQMDWGVYAQTYGAEQAVAAMAQANQLRDARSALTADISAKESEFNSQRQAAEARALQEAEQVLSREIQGFGPQLVQTVAKAASDFGFTAEEIRASFIGDDGGADVRTFKALARLAQLEAENAELRSKQTKTQTAQKVAKIQPAATVNTKGGGYKPGLDDSLPVDEWMRRRHAQIAKSRAG